MNSVQKRRGSAFIPFKRTEHGVAIFLQLRTKDAPTNPGCYGAFGGGAEGDENPRTTLIREVWEELHYKPSREHYLQSFETADAFIEVYTEEVGKDFENHITVLEGERGQFFTQNELLAEERIGVDKKQRLLQIIDQLRETDG